VRRLVLSLAPTVALMLLVVFMSPAVVPAFLGPPLSPAEVVEIDRARDGQVIELEGEAVGEHLRAIGGGRWVNVLGDEVGIGVWVTDEMAAQIEYFGDYRHDGDIVRVRGPVNISCEEHGGEFDVHAQSLEIVTVGGPREHDLDLRKGLVGIVGIAIAAFLWLLYGRRRDRRML
jgi:hypothetical protein